MAYYSRLHGTVVCACAGHDRTTLGLPGAQQQLLEAVVAVAVKRNRRVVLVTLSGGALAALATHALHAPTTAITRPPPPSHESPRDSSLRRLRFCFSANSVLFLGPVALDWAKPAAGVGAILHTFYPGLREHSPVRRAQSLSAARAPAQVSSARRRSPTLCLAITTRAASCRTPSTQQASPPSRTF